MLLFSSLSWIYFLLQAAYVINGNCKNVMNMSQPDQVELWGSVLNGKTFIFIFYRKMLVVN